MRKRININVNKEEWILLCLTIGGILGILAWNVKVA